MKAGFWQIGRWKDVPIVLHWSAFLPLAWYTVTNRDFAAVLPPFLALLVLMTVHELGHAAAARSRGLDVVGIRLYFLLGVCEHEAPERQEDDVFIAWAGVLAQMGLLGVALVVLWAAGTFLPDSARVLMPILFVFIHLNIAMAVLNLIPVAPLDGHKAWRILPMLWHRVRPHLSRRDPDAVRRREVEASSRTAADELFDRLRKKQDDHPERRP